MDNNREILRMAQMGYVTIIEQYQKRIENIEAQLSKQAEHPAPGMPRKRKRFSAETRAKMAKSQRARWTVRNGNKPPKEKKTSRTMSAAARKAISDFQKARWRKLKAQRKATKAKPKTMTAGS